MRALAAMVVAVGLVVGFAAAAGAVEAGAPQESAERRERFADRVGEELGVSGEKVQGAVRAAFAESLTEAVERGRITQRQAEEALARYDDGGLRRCSARHRWRWPWE